MAEKAEMAQNVTKAEKRVPKHVAIIMDGNGRWAQRRGLDRPEGHIAGVESVRRVVKAAVARNVSYLTLYTFSTENWGRPIEEVNAIMELFCRSVIAEAPELKEQGVKVKLMGDRRAFSEKVNSYIDKIENETAEGDKLTLVLAMNYSSRYEITDVVKQMVEQAAAGKLGADQITTDYISSQLYSRNYPDPDLIVRTGGEYRLSNFLMWQAAYSELYFTPTLWPDFDKDSFDEALEAYAQRDRRYGLVSSEEK